MRLTFVLPALFDHPIGGYKVHYQYANALAARGHAVTLVHAITDRGDPSFRDLVALRAVVRQAVTKKPAVSWFAFHPSIRSVLVPVLSGRSLPEADVTVLTAWQTAQYTRGRAAQAGVFAQIVYDYEFWMSIPRIRARMRKALSREDVCPIATSGVVAAMLREIGREPVATVQAGLLEGEFGVDAPIDGREKLVAFQRRSGADKDLSTALAVAELILAESPDVRLECYGRAKGKRLPEGIRNLGQISQAELRALYNRSRVFMLSSRYEGWGLPAAEAMACGAAVVSTRCGGVEDFLVDGRNGLLVPVGDPSALASAVMRLLRDDKERVLLATHGSHDAVQMSVQRSAQHLEQVLSSLLTAHSGTRP
ncbi:MAG: glycosyltransferase family 4 protein [Acidimicrobiales bacterium]